MGVARFDDSSSTKNPLPNHVDNGVDVRAGRGLVISNSGGNHGETRNRCEFHHDPRECEIQGLGSGHNGRQGDEAIFDDSSSTKNPLPNHVDNGVDVRAGRGLVISNSGGNHGETRNRCEFHHDPRECEIQGLGSGHNGRQGDEAM
ncbi:hypothetical protein GOBAR_DD31675 [Gossypium barbadense]|nr:hypothetical protein GOBAR_DD31675 [Gossypium barbadense]